MHHLPSYTCFSFPFLFHPSLKHARPALLSPFVSHPSSHTPFPRSCNPCCPKRPISPYPASYPYTHLSPHTHPFFFSSLTLPRLVHSLADNLPSLSHTFLSVATPFYLFPLFFRPSCPTSHPHAPPSFPPHVPSHPFQRFISPRVGSSLCLRRPPRLRLSESRSPLSVGPIHGDLAVSKGNFRPTTIDCDDWKGEGDVRLREGRRR